MTQLLPSSDLQVDITQIKKNILELATIGRSDADRGIYRMAFTDADMEGKRWLLDRIEEAGLETASDGAANIFGKIIPSGEAADRPAILMGSHIDTVPCAGSLDGSLGVVVALECLRTLRANEVELRRPLEMVAFSDEEGRFGGMFGSQAFCGLISPDTLHHKDLDGIALGDAMLQQGLDPVRALDAARPRESIEAYIELHIEQGPVLDRSQTAVGIVENITGLFKWQVRFHGDANHAGTTPMEMRNDAFMGLADFAHELPRIIDENGSERSRATIGKAEILPGSANTVPGLVEFSLDVRDTDPDVLKELGLACQKVLAAIARRRGLRYEHESLSCIEPVACDPDIVRSFAEEAERLGLKSMHMPSGAAHDAQILGGLTRMGMLFAPSRGGKSHTPEEWTAWEDIEAAANLSLHTLLRLANA
jgi:N-carbamoyl-L-amino-acid hydrolase